MANTPQPRSTSKEAEHKVTFDEETWRRLDNARYWEGYGTVAKFVRATMDRYIRQRETERGGIYKAKPKGAPEPEDS